MFTYEANIAERGSVWRRIVVVVEREALVFGGEFVSIVDAVVAGITEGSFVGGAE